jgi:hypothetical protein
MPVVKSSAVLGVCAYTVARIDQRSTVKAEAGSCAT